MSPHRAGRWAAVTSAAAVALAVLLTVTILATGTATPRATSARATLTDIAVRDRYVPNPGMGWQDNSRRRPRHPQTVEYLRPRNGWAGLNPAPGRYRWATIDRALRAAARRGNRLGLRVYSMRGPGDGGHRVPRWARRKGVRIVGGEPDYGSRAYQTHWSRFVEALRRRYDGDPRLAFVDISGYGDYGEWSWEAQTTWERDWRRPRTVDGHARRRLVDLFVGGSGTARVRTARGDVQRVRYRYRGFQRTQLLMPYAGIRQSLWYALSRRRDVGWRHDCLGRMTTSSVRAMGTTARRRWRAAPVVFEFCSRVNWSRARSVLRMTRGVLVHDNATSGPGLRRLLSDVGYRYTLRRADRPTTARAGGALTVRMSWRNAGTALAYPTLGVTPRLRLRLTDRRGRTVQSWTASASVVRWKPGSTTPVTTRATVRSDLRPGPYRLSVAIVNTSTGRPLALPMRRTATSGWFPLGTVSVLAER